MEEKYFSGIFCMVICDIIIVATSFVVKEYQLPAPDIAFSKGWLQLLFFLLISFCGDNCYFNPLSEYREIVEGDNQIESEKQKPSEFRFVLPQNRNDKVWTLFFGFLCGVWNTTGFAAVIYVPVLDFTVFASSTVFFTLVFAYFWIDNRFTLMDILIVILWNLTLLGGICLASKPSFIFGSNNIGLINENQYWIGVLLSLLYSITGGIVSIIPKKSSNVVLCHLMIWAGIGDVVGACLIYGLPAMRLNIFTPSNLSTIQWSVVVCLSIGSVAMNSALIYGFQIGSPVINVVIRRSDLLLVLLVNMTYLKVFPDYIETIGYILILVSIAIKILADKQRKSES